MTSQSLPSPPPSPQPPADGDITVASDGDNALTPPVCYEEPTVGSAPIGAIALVGVGAVARIIAFGGGSVAGLTLIGLCVTTALQLAFHAAPGVAAAWWAAFGVLVPGAALFGVAAGLARDITPLGRLALVGFAAFVAPYVLIGLIVVASYLLT